MSEAWQPDRGHSRGAERGSDRARPRVASQRLGLTRRTDRPRGHQGTSGAEAAIFAATEQLLEREPLHELSVAAIMAEAGVSRATFYFYFSSKYAVVVGLLAEVMDEMFDSVQPFITRDAGMTPQEGLRASIQAGVEMWLRHRPALRAIHEHWNTTEELRSLWLSVIARFTQALAEQIDRDRAAGISPPGPDSRALASTLLWGAECCLYVAGLDVDPSFRHERDMLEPLYVIWNGALFGAAPPAVDGAPWGP
ncbi:MAG TPA: TetR/AcrR family transcriptional regulator [Solirubrobacteraceae bacterium]|nr:TetR/AcrR family transcriptional regulator [Solirubrobacteraceae bacterium]